MPSITAGSFNVEYLDIGSGPAVLLVHSSASGHRQWRRLIESLKDRNRLMAVNLFGYGSTTPWPAGRAQTLSDQAELISAVAAIIGEPVILVGHSLGGAVSLEAAYRLGAQVRALIAFEPILFHLLRGSGPADPFNEISDIADRYRALAANGKWDDVGALFVDYWSGPGTWSAMPDDRKTALHAMLPNVVHEWDAVIPSSGRALSDWAVISAETHLIRAADTRRPTYAISTLLADTHRHWHLHEIVTGGHMAPVARPDIVNPLIVQLLAEHRPTGAR